MGLNVYLYEKPVASAPVTPTTATLGTLTAIGSTLGGNQYQSNLRVDPNNAQRQAVTFKTGTAETDTAILWTTDGWSTQSSYSLGSSGDPDCVWDGSGNLYYSYIDKGASDQTKVRKLSSPYTSFGSAVAVGINLDHPNIQYDSVRDRLIITGRVKGGGNVYVCYSDNANTSWTANAVGNPDGGNEVAFGGCRAPNGDFVFHLFGNVLATPQNGYFVARTSNFSSISTTSSIATWPGTFLGFGQYGNIDSDGTYLYAPINVAVSSAAQPYIKRSSDSGVTWGSAVSLGTMPTGYGVVSTAVKADAQKVVVFLIGVTNYGSNIDYRFYFTWSTDQGATWTALTELSNGATTWSTGQPRLPGQDQYYFDMVGDTAYVAFPKSASNVMTTQYRTITFS